MAGIADCVEYPSDLLPTERSALTVWWLVCGYEVTVAALAEAFDIEPRSARRILNKVARVVPIYSNGQDNGVWKVCEMSKDD